MVIAFRPLHKLAYLRVVIRTNLYHAKLVPGMQYSEELARALRGSAFDLEGTAASLVVSLPSLRYVFPTATGNLFSSDGDTGETFERWHVSQTWRVAKLNTDGMRDGRPMLVPLHDEVAKTIIRKEEVVLSYADRRSAWCRVSGKVL